MIREEILYEIEDREINAEVAMQRNAAQSMSE